MTDLIPADLVPDGYRIIHADEWQEGAWWEVGTDPDRATTGWTYRPPKRFRSLLVRDIPPPCTEQVPLAQIIGRTLPGCSGPVRVVYVYRDEVIAHHGGVRTGVTVEADGTVEVLAR